jgi:hypothetical protein
MLESSILRCISSSGTPPQRSFHRDAAGCKSASQVAVVLVSAAPSVQRPYQSVERYHSSIMDVPALSSASSTSSTVSASNKPLKPTDPAFLLKNYAALSFFLCSAKHTLAQTLINNALEEQNGLVSIASR